MKLVGLIVMPLSAAGFGEILLAFDKEYPGCTLGESAQSNVHVGELGYIVQVTPVLADDDSS